MFKKSYLNTIYFNKNMYICTINKNNMKHILKLLKIVQVVSNEERHKNGLKRLGKGYFKAYRLNPYNPLSYIVVIIAIPIIILMYGFVGLFDKISNPFKWD